MQPIAAYAIVRAREDGRLAQPARRDRDVERTPRVGFGARIRKLFGSSPRLRREPGFAASRSGWLDGYVPLVRAYPFPPTYR